MTDFRNDFNTQLTPDQEQAFQQWILNTGRTNDLTNYDLRGAFLEGLQPDERGHLPDTYKKPNHPTFSSESIYNGHGSVGGDWVPGPNDTWTFQASKDNLKHQTPQELQAYFKQVEPDSQLILPLAESMLQAKGF